MYYWSLKVWYIIHNYIGYENVPARRKLGDDVLQLINSIEIIILNNLPHSLHPKQDKVLIKRDPNYVDC